MMAPPRKISATEFKAKCLGLLDEIQESGGELVITKHGKPVAKLVSAVPPVSKTSRGSVRGRIRGDIVNVNWAHLWEFAK
jgi:prevent-host-death family protein